MTGFVLWLCFGLCVPGPACNASSLPLLSPDDIERPAWILSEADYKFLDDYLDDTNADGSPYVPNGGL